MALGLNGFGPKWQPFALSHFRAQKSLDFQGPPLPITFKIIKWITILTTVTLILLIVIKG
jgi:hypothetical protein